MAALDSGDRQKTANKEDDTMVILVQVTRGYEFLPMDVYKSDARYFVVDGKLLPPLHLQEWVNLLQNPEHRCISVKILSKEICVSEEKKILPINW